LGHGLRVWGVDGVPIGTVESGGASLATAQRARFDNPSIRNGAGARFGYAGKRGSTGDVGGR
jgi:hypothetical protein